MDTPKIEYLNRTQGWLSVRLINRRGEEESRSLEPGDRVFMTDEEREITARSHRLASDSPFVPREIVWHAMSTGEEIARFTAPMLQAVHEIVDVELPEVVGMRDWDEQNAKALAAQASRD